MRDEWEKVQNKLKEKYFATLKGMGYANVGNMEIDSDVLARVYDTKDLDPSKAMQKAELDIKKAEAEVYFDDHELAPRKWRTYAAGKRKEF